jgi:hypothetical protein
MTTGGGAADLVIGPVATLPQCLLSDTSLNSRQAKARVAECQPINFIQTPLRY